jgi:hypothetical protein
MKSKFEFKDNRPLSVKVKDFMQSLLFWKGRKKGIIYTRDIGWGDIRQIFFPKNFSEKYSYLGSVPYNPKSDTFVALLPLVLAMDYEAKPKWCPRWVLRFLYVFGDDKSIVRVRNRFLSNLSKKLTGGITLYDYKTKWSYYDLRISIAGPKYLQDLADDIERAYYNRGKRQELISTIRGYDPSFNRTYITVGELQEYLEQISQKE